MRVAHCGRRLGGCLERRRDDRRLARCCFGWEAGVPFGRLRCTGRGSGIEGRKVLAPVAGRLNVTLTAICADNVTLNSRPAHPLPLYEGGVGVKDGGWCQ